MGSVLEWSIKKKKVVVDKRVSVTAINMGIHLQQQGEEARLKFALPLHVSHLAEGLGLFVMIILGESIISIMSVDYELTEEYITTIVLVFANFISCWMIGRLYYDCQPPEEDIMHSHDKHALKLDPMKRYNIPIRIIYLGAHHVLFIALLGYGIGVKIAVSYFHKDTNLGIYVRLPCWSLTVVIACLNVIRMTHPMHKPILAVWIMRVFVLIAMGVLPIFATIIQYQGYLWAAEIFCLFLLILVDVEGRHIRNEAKQKKKDARHKEKMDTKHQGSKNVRMTDRDSLGLEDLRKELSDQQIKKFEPKVKTQTNGMKASNGLHVPDEGQAHVEPSHSHSSVGHIVVSDDDLRDAMEH